MLSHKPRIAVVLGDPAGVGPELVARLLAEPGNRLKAHVLLVADRDELETGMRLADSQWTYDVADGISDLAFHTNRPLLRDVRGHANATFVRAAPSANAGRYALDSLREALRLIRAGAADALLFAPLNKTSLHEAGFGFADEGQWFADILSPDGPTGELNVLDRLMTSRVTSHVPLKDVAGLIDESRIVSAIRLAHATLVSMGVEAPRIAVCGLNPHAGDHGNFGREEIEVIAPALARAHELGYPCTGPFPADTIFLKAPDVDAVVTMYHDQGQIAMKLLGFSKGVTFYGGFPIPIATPAHGTAFDIYGRGVANPGAIQAAFDLLCRVVARRSP